jgi:predicted permease
MIVQQTAEGLTPPMMTVVNSLLPIFLVIGLGAALRATGFLSQEFFTGMNKLCYWVALPALLFYKVAGATFEGETALSIFWVLLIATLGLAVLGYILAIVLRLPARSWGAFVQAAFRGNLLAASTAAIVKIAVAPLIGYLVAGWLGAGPTETCIALVYLACPTAIISYVLAEQLGGDHVLSGSAVVVSTLSSMVSLAVIVFAFS